MVSQKDDQGHFELKSILTRKLQHILFGTLQYSGS